MSVPSVTSHDLCGAFAAACEPDAELAAVRDDVTVGHDQTVGAYNEPRAEPNSAVIGRDDLR
jgi:hypothetical protein